MINTDYLITLADMSEDSLFEIYKEAMAKLKNKDTSQLDRKVFVMRVMYIRSLISDRYGLRIKNNPDFDNPMNNESVASFYK